MADTVSNSGQDPLATVDQTVAPLANTICLTKGQMVAGAIALAATVVGAWISLSNHDAVQAVEMERIKLDIAELKSDHKASLQRILDRLPQRYLTSMPGPAGDADDAPEFGEAMPEITADTIQEEDERGPH